MLNDVVQLHASFTELSLNVLPREPSLSLEFLRYGPVVIDGDLAADMKDPGGSFGHIGLGVSA